MILEISYGEQIEVVRSNDMIEIGIDDDFNQCVSNNYDGDHAYIEITIDQAQKLLAMLQKAINDED